MTTTPHLTDAKAAAGLDLSQHWPARASAAPEHVAESVFELRDRRQLAFCCYGDPLGRPLYFFHGFPGSRLQASFLDSRAHAAGVCLVAIDRPGFGRSTHDPRRTLRDWPNDVVQLADHLGHPRFDVMGVSCGGAYALVCAHDIPQRIGSVALMAGIGPMDLPAIRVGQLPLLTAMFKLARIHPWLVSPLLGLDWLLFRGNAERAVKVLASMLTEPDRRLLASDSTVAAGFGASLAEAYRQGPKGAMREAQLIGSPRGFALADIKVPVHIFQGGHDRHVPPGMGRYLARELPNARLHFHAHEGHLSIVLNCFRAAVAWSDARSLRSASPSSAPRSPATASAC